jgi:hypothetical protein
MPLEELRNFLRARPFVPIRIALTDGRTFEVRHPEMLMLGARAIVIGIPQEGAKDPIFEHSITVTLLHVVSVEPLEAPAATQKGNGAQG